MVRNKGEKGKKRKKKEIVIIIFVEGETEEKFYKELIKFLINKNQEKDIRKYEVVNLRGIGKFESKMIPKFENGIMNKPRYEGCKFSVACSYDEDVFIYQSHPAVDWDDKVTKFRKLKVEPIILISAKEMIEDWFLIDYQGLCKYLNIPIKYPTGNNGNKKMQNLFKAADKVYIKGSDTGDFVPSLDMNKIYIKLKDKFKDLEDILFIKD